MNADFFVDSNVCLYAFDKDGIKKRKAIDLLLGSGAIISTQVLMETANVASRKLGMDALQIKTAIDFISSLCTVQSISKIHVDKALIIHGKYGFSLYDSLIVAAALLFGCTVLYSEDLQHLQRIDGKLTIMNPFK